MEDSSRNNSQTDSSVATRDSSEDNPQQTTSSVNQSLLAPSTIIIIIITAIVLIFIIITILITLIVLRKFCTKRKEKLALEQCKNSEKSADDCDNSSVNKQSRNDCAQDYSEVSEYATTKKMTEENSGNIYEEKNNEMAVYYSIIRDREELDSRREVRNDLDLLAAVDESAKKKKKVQKETASLYANVN